MILVAHPLQIQDPFERSLHLVVESPTEDLGVFENGVRLCASEGTSKDSTRFEVPLTLEPHVYEVRYMRDGELHTKALETRYDPDEIANQFSQHIIEYDNLILLIKGHL